MEELKKPQRSVSSTKNHGLGSRGSPVLGEFLRVILRWLGSRSTFWQVRYVASCFFWCVTPYCIVFCSVCPLTVNLLLQEPATVHRCVHVDRVLYLHAGQRVLLHSAHQRRVSVLLGSRCGKKLSTMGVVYKTKGCTIRKQEVVVKNKGLW